MLCTFQPLAKGDLVDHVLHTLIMYKDCFGIMKDQCKNSRLPHLLMIVVHGETLWSPAPQPMDDDDDKKGARREEEAISHNILSCKHSSELIASLVLNKFLKHMYNVNQTAVKLLWSKCVLRGGRTSPLQFGNTHLRDRCIGRTYNRIIYKQTPFEITSRGVQD